jgi:hypothetical protein
MPIPVHTILIPMLELSCDVNPREALFGNEEMEFVWNSIEDSRIKPCNLFVLLSSRELCWYLPVPTHR